MNEIKQKDFNIAFRNHFFNADGVARLMKIAGSLNIKINNQQAKKLFDKCLEETKVNKQQFMENSDEMLTNWFVSFVSQYKGN